jgi:hypothetical protein
MFENKVQRKIFRPKWEEETGAYNLYSSPNIIRVIRTRRMGRSGHTL